jgi:hypothetical protein
MQFGTQESGFSADYEAASNAVLVHAWGFWDATLAATFASRVLGLCAQARRQFTLRLDGSRLLPQRAEGQEALRQFAVGLSRFEAERVVAIIPNSITKLQLVRILKESGVQGWSVVASENALASTAALKR